MKMMMGTKARRNMKGKTLLRKEKWNGEKSMDGRFGVKTCMFVLFFYFTQFKLSPLSFRKC